VIEMYFSDHPPPHFHARYGGEDATVVIETGEVLDDLLPGRALRLVRRPLAGHWLQLEFPDGAVEEVDLGEVLARGGVFAPIHENRAVFGQLRVNPESQTIEWPGEIDLDPEVLYGRYEPASGAHITRRTVREPAHA
jgi:hypothetical protein